MNEQIIKVLEVLASKLGTTSEYLWEILVKQAYVNSIIYTVLLISCCVCCYYWVKYISRVNLDNLSNEEELFSIIAFIFISVILGVWSILSVVSIYDIITGFLNPEYWALQKILLQLK